MKTKLIIFFIFIITLSLNSLNYITTAKSVSWSGAYTSVADGFEAMLYNPAGLFFTQTKFGLNFFGTYGFRMYNNSISSADAYTLYATMNAGHNLTKAGILGKLLTYMPESGMDVGLDASGGNLMTYVKLEKWGFGVSVLPKFTATANLPKGVFDSLFNELNLTSDLNYRFNAFILSYIDYNFILSTRAYALEKLIPVDGIFVGLSSHVYLPVMFVKPNLALKLGPGDPNPTTGFIDSYKVKMKGDLVVGANGLFSTLFKNNSYIKGSTGEVFDYAGSSSFGLGLDMGFLVKFNKYVRVGFAITDLGFFVFPSTAVVHTNYEQDLSLDKIGSFYSSLYSSILSSISENTPETGSIQWWIPPTSMRVGVAVTPFSTGIVTWATDISLSDFDRILVNGYPVFNFSTGIEFLPGYKWFSVPLRIAFCYNSLSNIPSFSAGFGLYFGPVEMEIGLKGLEFLISGWGAKEVSAGFDLKYEF